MATDCFTIEEFLDTMEIKYFCRSDENGSQWVVLTDHGYLVLFLNRDGEILCIQSQNLLSQSKLSLAQVHQLQADLLERNHLLSTGSFSMLRQEVFFECSIALKDAPLTQLQLRHLLGATMFEVKQFGEHLEKLHRTETLGEGSLERIMRIVRDAFGHVAEKADQNRAARILEEQPQESYRVMLTGRENASTVGLIACIKKHRGNLSLHDCKQIVESVPAAIGDWNTRSEAEEVVKELVDLGARAVII